MVGLIGYLSAAWAILCEDDWYWPALVFFGSVSAQAHLTYVVPLGTVGLLVLVPRWYAGFAIGRSDAPSRPARSTWRILAVKRRYYALACWAGPLANQFWGSGNLFNVVTAGNSGVHPVGLKSASPSPGGPTRHATTVASQVYPEPSGCRSKRLRARTLHRPSGRCLGDGVGSSSSSDS